MLSMKIHTCEPLMAVLHEDEINDITRSSLFFKEEEQIRFPEVNKVRHELYISCHWYSVSQTFFLWGPFGVGKTRYVL